jgi:prolyl oligopeptidase
LAAALPLLRYIAELQYTAGTSAGQTNPLLIKVDTKAGHGAGKPTSKVIEEAAHYFAFIANATGAAWNGE